MATTAKIICDSVAPSGVRLTTFVLKYPRYIHSEVMTHRMFSRNASSSRAIPVTKFMQRMQEDPVIPVEFSKNQPGMQASENIQNQEEAKRIWLEARDAILRYSEQLNKLGVHKQHVNRLGEPFHWIEVVCTATDFNNFFALRYHPAAQPEICELAKKMWEAYSTSTPKQLKEGEWHLPFIAEEGDLEVLLKRSVARCARVSYLNHDGTSSTVEQDLQLYERLVGSAPIHASPAEHQAKAIADSNIRSGNFRGWIQYRKTLPNENIQSFTPIKEDNDN
jgi:thymidylate synthase ThyX